MIGDEVNVVSEVSEGSDPEVDTDGSSPGLEKGFGGQHENIHWLKDCSGLFGISFDNLLDEVRALV